MEGSHVPTDAPIMHACRHNAELNAIIDRLRQERVVVVNEEVGFIGQTICKLSGR